MTADYFGFPKYMSWNGWNNECYFSPETASKKQIAPSFLEGNGDGQLEQAEEGTWPDTRSRVATGRPKSGNTTA